MRIDMKIGALDHVNLRTARLEPMRRFYIGVLGLREGPRPNFDFQGAWLYAEDQACVHLVEVTESAKARDDLALSHFAFRATGHAELLSRLEQQKIPYRQSSPPDWHLVQVHLRDPDGNHIHIDFDSSD